MKQKMLLSLALAVTASLSTAFATPACSDGATDNGSTYFSGGYSCQVGDLLFSDFSYTASGDAAIPLSEITVDTVGPAGSGASISGPNIGLDFHAPWNAGAGMTSDGTIDFTVSVVSGGDLIEDFGLAQTSGVSGNGTASVIERGCGPAPCSATGGSLYVLTFQDESADSAQGETTFSSYSAVEVEKDIAVNGNDGFAGISVVEDTFSQSAVPEPTSMGLLGGGLALLGLGRWRRSGKKAKNEQN